MFGISDPFVDRIGLSTKSVEIDETLWRPHFDDKFDVQFPCSANDPKLRQIQQICQELANDDTLILQVGDQENICSDANILSACQGHPGASIQAGFTTKCFATTFSWIAFGDFVSSEPTAESPFEIYDVWSKWDTKMKNMVLKYPQVSSAFAVSSSWSSSVYTVLAVKGSIWSIAVSYLLSFVAVCIFMMEGRSITITMLSILVNVVLVVGGFHALGWSLGAVEAVSFSILVGTSVDYFLHLIEGYRHASEDCDLQDATKSEIRIWCTTKAITTVGVPIFSSALTTAGCAVMLCFTDIQPLKRFGQIIVLNTVVSTLLTFFFAGPMLMLFGSQKLKITYKRCGKTFLILLSIFGILEIVIAATGLSLNPNST